MHSKSEKQQVGARMSEASDQTGKSPDLKPALGENIKELPEDEVKDQVAERMSESGQKRGTKPGAR